MLRKTRHSKATIEAIKSDRVLGLSIIEIASKYNLPKTTVWHHIHNVMLSDAHKLALQSRKGSSAKRAHEQQREAEAYAKLLMAGSQKTLIHAVAMLYWAEGHKKALVFTNTDKKMLTLYITFLLEVFQVSHDRISVLVRTSDPIKPKVAVNHWATQLHLAPVAFKSNHDNIQNRTKTTYGICRIEVKKSAYLHKVMMSLVSLVQDSLLQCSDSSTDRTPHS